MRFGIFVVTVGRHAGGPETYETSLVRSLARIDRENEYHVYCLSGAAAEALGVEQANFHLHVLKPAARRVSIPLTLPLSLLRDGVPSYHATFTPPPFSPRPYVFTHHSVTPLTNPEFYEPQVLPRLKRLIEIGLKKARRIICVSQTTLDLTAELLRVPRERMEVVHNGVGPQFRPVDKDEARRRLQERFGLDGRYVFFVGKMQPRKNIPRIIEAFHAFQKETQTDLRLVLAGDPAWGAAERDRLIDRLNLNGKVLQPGVIEDDDLPLFYSGADMFVFPSLEEGFGIPVVEAMACGTPVITSNVACLPEVAGDAALLVEPRSVEQIAAAMQRVHTDAPLRAQMQSKGLKRAELFSWDNTARRTRAVYERVLRDL